MSRSYKKLWKLMIDKEINKTQLTKQAKISTNSMAKLGRNESVPLETLEKICTVLSCTLDDIVEFSEDEKEGMNDILKIGKITVRVIDNILQLTDAPDIVTSGDGDKYIGYEYIGEAYSGSRKYAVDEGDTLFADYISEETGNGVFLDIGCGDGCITVPSAKNGTRIIAGDISNAMMKILQERAEQNGVSLKNVTLCRMNALDIPIKDKSVDCVIANSVLHLISNPQRVLNEIFRVLKPGGRFVCREDAPGKESQLGKEYVKENQEYLQIINGIYGAYWSELNARGIYAKKYSWRFDRDSACREMFGAVETRVIECGTPYFNRLVDIWLPRFAGRGFSDQVDVPPEVHKEVCDKVVTDFRARYGELFDTIGYHGVEDDIVITSYVK